MGSKTRIIILRMKEIIYTVLFILFALIMIFLFLYMFFLKDSVTPGKQPTEPTYTPGVYTSSILLGDRPVNLSITVDSHHINSITVSPLEESVTAMYPLLESCLENITVQLTSGVPIDQVVYDKSSQYTASLLLEAIDNALKKASD